MAAQAQFPTLYPAPNLNNTLGTGSALDAVDSYSSWPACERKDRLTHRGGLP